MSIGKKASSLFSTCSVYNFYGQKLYLMKQLQQEFAIQFICNAGRKKYKAFAYKYYQFTIKRTAQLGSYSIVYYTLQYGAPMIILCPSLSKLSFRAFIRSIICFLYQQWFLQNIEKVYDKLPVLKMNYNITIIIFSIYSLNFSSDDITHICNKSAEYL